MDLNKYKRNPEENNGWHFDYKFIKELSDMTNAGTFNAGMEEVESVLKALCDREDVDKSESSFAIPVVVGTLCQCTEWEGTAEDGTCYECRKPHRDNY